MTEQEHWEALISALRRESPDEAMDEADWDEISRLAQELGVAPLLYSRVQDRPIPPSALQKLRTAYTHTAMHNTRVYHFLGQALDALSEANVPVILLKGAHLAKCVYGNIAVRPMGDVDVLVTPDKGLTAARVVESLGYKAVCAATREWITKRHHLPHFTNEAGITLEVHAGPRFVNLRGPISDEEFAGLWERARDAEIDGRRVSALSPEDEILYLCLHASTADGFRVDLRPILDIAQVVERYADEIDWDAFIARARKWGYLRAACFTLRLAEMWAGAKLPSVISNLVTPEMNNPSTIAYVRKKLLSAPFEHYVAEFRTRDGMLVHSINLRAVYGRKGYRFRLWWILGSVFPSAGDMRKAYPKIGRSAWRLMLAHATRIARAMWFYPWLIWRLASGKVTFWHTIPHEQRLREIVRRDRE